MNIPPMVYVIGVLGVVWLIVRVMAQKADARRQEERDERMARLMEERERILAKRDEPPSSLGAVVSDSSPPTKNERPPSAGAEKELPDATVKVRCRKCRALNDESATTCSSCEEPL